MTAALKEQFPRHCFIKIQGRDTQPLLVPMIDQPYTSEENLLWYRDWQLQQQSALPAAEVDQLLIEQETKFLEAAGQVVDITSEPLPEIHSIFDELPGND